MTLETMTPIAMVRSSICPQWQPDQGTQLSLMQSLLHHVLGHDRLPPPKEFRCPMKSFHRADGQHS
jgi:hypothetical protein